MTQADQPNDRKPLLRVAHIVAAVAIGVAVVGFFIGLGQRHEPRDVAERRPSAVEPPPTDRARTAPQAPSYREIPASGFLPNADYTPHLNELPAAFPLDALFDDTLPTEAQRCQALKQRQENRAFDGAPPTVPHTMEQLNTASCIACHQSGARIGDRIATQMSHQHLANCTQCHVESQHRTMPDHAVMEYVGSTFGGLQTPGKGERTFEGAPPTIPHGIWMRENCLSCHGPQGPAGLRASHAWRTSCTQCHAPSAELDQHDFQVLKQVLGDPAQPHTEARP